MIWGLGTTFLSSVWLPAGIAFVALSAALHGSLSHEALHGHPTKNAKLNEMLVFPALTLVIPYQRFRDTHLAHHQDSILTDPYDDPESNYLDPAVWARLPQLAKMVLTFNNRLLGRMTVGPLVSQIAFMQEDAKAIRSGDKAIFRAWLFHIPAVGLIVWWMAAMGQMPVWAFCLSVYLALSILKIRTFLEHRAHEFSRARTVVIEDRGCLAFLFLNNNFHVVHHMHPKVPWYKLPAKYAQEKSRYLARNDGYVYKSYPEILKRYFFRAKDPVPHPLWPRR